MSRIKVSKTAPTLPEKDRQSKEWPVVVYLWAFGLAILGYAVGRVGLSSSPHPYHCLFKIGGFFTTGHTPRGPEINDYNLAAQFA